MKQLERGKVDLRTCKPGDVLIGAHGAEMWYVRRLYNSYYPHEVEYFDSKLGKGTRTHDGHVWYHARIPEIDEDIVMIIPT
jgi:hypothetical protein